MAGSTSFNKPFLLSLSISLVCQLYFYHWTTTCITKTWRKATDKGPWLVIVTHNQPCITWFYKPWPSTKEHISIAVSPWDSNSHCLQPVFTVTTSAGSRCDLQRFKGLNLPFEKILKDLNLPFLGFPTSLLVESQWNGLMSHHPTSKILWAWAAMRWVGRAVSLKASFELASGSTALWTHQ